MSRRPNGTSISTGGHGVCAGPPRDIEEEGGDPLSGGRPTKAHDLIVRSRHLAADRGKTLRAEILAVVDELIEAVPSKPSQPDRCHGFCRERIDIARTTTPSRSPG